MQLAGVSGKKCQLREAKSSWNVGVFDLLFNHITL